MCIRTHTPPPRDVHARRAFQSRDVRAEEGLVRYIGIDRRRHHDRYMCIVWAHHHILGSRRCRAVAVCQRTHDIKTDTFLPSARVCIDRYYSRGGCVDGTHNYVHYTTYICSRYIRHAVSRAACKWLLVVYIEKRFPNNFLLYIMHYTCLIVFLSQ